MFFTSWISNSYEEDTPTGNQNIPRNNNYHFRDSSSDSSDAVQFKKLPVRRYTLPGKLGLSKFWEAGRDSSVQVAM
ncbi:16557_t:CDS:2, partial [Rhizophagus irregularis]